MICEYQQLTSDALQPRYIYILSCMASAWSWIRLALGPFDQAKLILFGALSS